MQYSLWTPPDRGCSPVLWWNKGVVEFILSLCLFIVSLRTTQLSQHIGCNIAFSLASPGILPMYCYCPSSIFSCMRNYPNMLVFCLPLLNYSWGSPWVLLPLPHAHLSFLTCWIEASVDGGMRRRDETGRATCESELRYVKATAIDKQLKAEFNQTWEKTT